MRPAPRGGLLAAALILLAATRCGGSSGDDGVPSSTLPDAATSDHVTPSGDAGSQADDPCTGDAVVASIASCIDGGGSPTTCLATARSGSSATCDVDADGLDDGLEDAMMRAYAPVFAYNLGDGGHTAGSTEPNWPDNAAHYTSNSTLLWRVDNDSSTLLTIDKAPTLASLPGAKNGTHLASSPVLGDGPNFWLCLNKPGGSYPADALVGTMEASRALKDGVDLFGVVHPTSAGGGSYAVLGYMIYYAYNSFSLDDHEGDWEGGAVFVDLTSGDVVALDTERHATADTALLTHLVGTSALPAKDPSGEAPHYDVCDPTNTSSIGGVRFWDYAGKKHHPVIYPAAGSHASYAYPGATKIQGLGCTEATMVRDVHNGNSSKLVPQDGAYYAGWDKSGKASIAGGLHFVNVGEPGHLRAAFTGFAGQWGCTLDNIPKSYPGPWDNQRLCRHWLTNDWGSAPPFTRSTATSCK